MRIESVEALPAGSACYVRVTTDTGLVGVGESTYFGWPTAVAEIVASFAPRMVGEDPFAVEHHGLMLYRALSMRGMAVTSAISALDQALWDIRGKRFEVPVWQLLGGRCRRAVRAMLVVAGETPEGVADACRAAVADGYGAIKVILFTHELHRLRQARRIEELVARLSAAREAVGWDVDLGVELHRNMSPGDAVTFCHEAARLRPLFVEDPIPPDSVLSFGAVAGRVPVPMAAGERNTTIYEFAEYVAQPGVAYVRPDVGIAGGITGVRKIAAIAEAHHQGVLPHAVPSGPVAVAAHVHVGIAVPNWEAQEHVVQDKPQWTDLVEAVVEVRGGELLAPDGPGLGVTLRDEGLRLHPPVSAALDGTPTREDGSVAIR